MKRKHGGNTNNKIDLSVNTVNFGKPESLYKSLYHSLDFIEKYPEPDAISLTKAIASSHGIDERCISVGNGCSEFFPQLQLLYPDYTFVLLSPLFTEYRYYCETFNIPYFELNTVACSEISALEIIRNFYNSNKDKKLLFILCNPNNPTGAYISETELNDCAGKSPNAEFLLDESFIDFVSPHLSHFNNGTTNISVIKSFTKFYGLAGLRVGCFFSNYERIEKLNTILPLWRINNLASRALIEMLNDEQYNKTIKTKTDEQRHLTKKIVESINGITVFPAAANFILCKCEDSEEIKKVFSPEFFELRNCDDFTFLDESYFRIRVLNDEEREILASISKTDLIQKASNSSRQDYNIYNTLQIQKKKPIPAIMFQGTSSNAGKSLITAGFCRYLKRIGFDVAPFKAQNMSLNSFVTPEGGEIGRAQAVQAQASMLPPHTDMNPILLKPSSQKGSQVIVKGHPIGNLSAVDYYQRKKILWESVRSSYDALSTNHDVIILEGAGSPAEINLKPNDIVNMKMADYADADVYLVGDIDRGGVFASFIGSYATFSQRERSLLKGFVINKFRGDPELLGNADEMLCQYTGTRSVGIIPMIKDLNIPDEDSYSFKDEMNYFPENNEAILHIAFIQLPHISNFSDILALSHETTVQVYNVNNIKTLESRQFDLVILPGSKNVYHDTEWLRNSGIFHWIDKHINDITVIGICGGMQMMGETILDPEGIEGNAGEKIHGLEILPLKSEIMKEKHLKLCNGKFIETDSDIHGYEIHHGETVCDKKFNAVVLDTGEVIGWKKENHWGSYMHGIFDSDPFRKSLIETLLAKKGITMEIDVTPYNIDESLDKLADILEESMDMKKILQNCGLS